MITRPHYSVYDGRTFVGSLAQDGNGLWLAKGQTFRTIGNFDAKREAIAAIEARYVMRCDTDRDRARETGMVD
jgi:hypothetical protein